MLIVAKMSPRSPTSVKSDKEIFPPSSEGDLGKAGQTSLAKRDLIVELSGDQKTTVRTTQHTNGAGVGGGDTELHSNVCQVQNELLKGMIYIDLSSHQNEYLLTKYYNIFFNLKKVWNPLNT